MRSGRYNQSGRQRFIRFSRNDLENILRLPLAVREKIAERIKQVMHEQKDAILQQAYKEKILTEAEYNQKYKDLFYGDFGMDSFIDYLNAAMNAPVDCFVTDNERILRNRVELEQNFGLKILSVQEAEEKVQDKK